MSLENIQLRSKTINDLKLPFKLLLGKIDKLTLKISWKTNFSTPTEIIIEGVTILLSLVKPSEWEYLDYISYESKLAQLMKYSHDKYMNLVNSFDSTGKTGGYTDRILIKILDNLHLVFKNINLRIEEPNKKPYYSIGLTLKEVLVINTNDKWKPHFVDRNVDKNASLFKVLEISSLGIYLQVDEVNFISSIDDYEEKYKKMKALFPDNAERAEGMTYLVNPISITSKMKQLNAETLTPENKEPLINVMIDLNSFETEIKKEQFNCIIFILNHISKYQKYQADYYETRKFSYFKPRDRNNKKQWIKFAFEMVVRQMKYLRGNKNIFSIPQNVMDEYKKNFNDLFENFFISKKKNQNFQFDEKSENFQKFYEIIYCVDIKLLQGWSKTIIEKIFKNEKIEEKKYAQQSYFSYFFGYGSKVDESKILSKEEEEKLMELFQSKEKVSLSNKDRNDLTINFTLSSGSFKCIKCSNLKGMNYQEGCEFTMKSLSFTLNQNASQKTFSIESTLQDIGANMFTVVNKTKNHIALAFKSFASEEVKLTTSSLFSVSGSQIISDDITSSNLSGGLMGSVISSGDEKNADFFPPGFTTEKPNYFIKLKFDYTPLSDVNSTLLFHIGEYNFTYHQVFLERLISFIKVEANEELTNKAINSMKTLTVTTQTAIKTNISKKNIIKMQIDPRKLIIPINKYDIKNSKILMMSFGLIKMDTSEPKNESEVDIKYKSRYNLKLESFSMSFFKSIKDLKRNVNRFDILTDISYTLGFSLLKTKQFSSKDYPSVKLFLDINNVTLHLTEYLYTILVYIMEIIKPTKEKDLWSQMTMDKKQIALNAKATAMILKKNWMTLNWENFLAMVSGGYIYFYQTSEDEEYTGYFYLKDSTIKPSIETLTMKVMNMFGTIEIKFQNEKKFKQWEKVLLERIEEMKTSYEEKSEEIGEELQKKKVDPYEIYFGAEITLRTVSVFLHQVKEEKETENIFSIYIKELSATMLLRQYDTSMELSIQGIKIYDNMSTTQDFCEMLTSEDSENKNIKLVTVTILLCAENSPRYKNIQMDINVDIGYLYIIWNPIIIRKLLHFLAHNKALRNKVISEITNPNEKLIEEKFIQPSEENKVSYPTCKEFKYTYLSIHSQFKKINIILIQPILNIMYHEMRFGESYLDCEMKVDHFIIKGELGNTQIFDLCEYPFIIPSQDKYNPKNKREIFGIQNQDSNSKSLISFEYISQSDWCPHFKDNYSSEANVKINSTFLIYVQEQFMRFLNYFISEFLGALGPTAEDSQPVVERPRRASSVHKSAKEKKDERDIRFFKLNLQLNNPLIILKPRIYFEEYFLIDLGNVNLSCFYNKIYGKVRNNPNEWRWMTTYQMKLNNFQIRTHDNFMLLSPTDGIINMHFVYYGESDKVLTPLEFDFSYQFDIMFNDFDMNMRQKDYTLLLKCSDLNILYTDNISDKFNYETLKEKKEKEKLEKKEENKEQSDLDKETKRLMADYIGMLVSMYIPKMNLTLYLDNDKFQGQFSKLSMNEMVLLFITHLDYSKDMKCVFGDFKIIHLDENYSQVIVSDFTQSIHDYENEFDYIEENINTDRRRDRKHSESIKNKILMRKERRNSIKAKNVLSSFGSKFSNYLVDSKLIPNDIISHLQKKQLEISMSIDIEREKSYLISLDNLKCLVRIDTIYLMQTFFMEGFPYYDKNMKDLPNLYDSNEENYPGMQFKIKIKQPLICFLSEEVQPDPNNPNNIKNQEMYCISSEIDFSLVKRKMIKQKNLLLNLKKSYSKAMDELKDRDIEDLKDEYEKELKKLKSITWEMKCTIDKISPFICDLDVIFDNSSFILKRKIMKNFTLQYKTQTILRIGEQDKFITSNKYKVLIDTITANMSLRDLILMKKTMKNNERLLGPTYQHNYESLRNYTHQKEKSHLEENNENNENTAIVLCVYKVEGFNLFLIDNNENTYFPFLGIQLSKVEYRSNSLGDQQSTSRLSITFLLLTYNYIAGLWEPLIELGEFEANMNSSIVEGKAKNNDCMIRIDPLGDSVLNVNISDLTLIFLFSIYERWMQMYSDLENKYETVIAAFDSQIKKMRVSNQTIFNYTGRKIFIFREEDESKAGTFAINDPNDDIRKSAISSTSIKEKKIGEIEPNGFYEVEYPYQDIFNSEEAIKADMKIKFCLEKTKVRDNEIKINRIISRVYDVEYQDVKLDNDLRDLNIVVSSVKIHDKKKYISIYSPISFKNKTQYQISFLFKKKNYNDLRVTLLPKHTFGVPFEYLNGTISVKIHNIRSKDYPIRKFYSPKEILKELKFDDIYAHFYHPKGEMYRNKVIMILTYYEIRNCLPFDVSIDIKSIDKQLNIPKGETLQCDMLSLSKDLNAKINTLNFTTKSYETLYKKDKMEKPSRQIMLYDEKGKSVDIICTIFKKNKVTIVLHPNTVLIDQTSNGLTFYYGNPSKNDEIPGKGEIGTVFLLKSDVTNIHAKLQDYVSESFMADKPGTSRVIRCKKKKENKYHEFILQNTLYLIANDLDLYCNIIDFEPKIVLWNELKEDIFITYTKGDDIESMLLQSDKKCSFTFFGYGEKIELDFLIVPIGTNINDAYDNKDTYNLIEPFVLNQRQFTTLFFVNKEKTKRRFINLRMMLKGIITYYIFKEATIETSKITIENHSARVSLKAYQDKYEQYPFYLDPLSSSIFTWVQQNDKNEICFQIGIGKLAYRPIMHVHDTKYELIDDKINVIKEGINDVNSFPYQKIIRVTTSRYSGYDLILKIIYDGAKYLIKIDDKMTKKRNVNIKIENYHLTFSIPKMGFSFIGDNTYIDCKKNFSRYMRKEICYILIKGLSFYLGVEGINNIVSTEIEFIINYVEIDNETAYVTAFPITLTPIESKKDQKENFFYFIMSQEEDKNEKTKIIKRLEYTLQSFSLNIDSYILKETLVLVNNITSGLKTFLTEVHPVFFSFEKNAKNSIICKGNYFHPIWINEKSFDNSKGILIQYLEASKIEISFSFLYQNKDKVFDSFTENNPILLKILSLFSNVDKTSIKIKGFSLTAIYGELGDIMGRIINTYKEKGLWVILKLFVNNEIFGNPMNLFESVGTGVKEFFEKPAKGIARGPVEGMKGIVNGSVSLVKNTVDGAFNTTSKLTSGISKGLLLITQDDDYINRREKKLMTEKPSNFVEGLGYGLTSMAGGILYGVIDIVRKPIEGAKKNKLKGFGKGLLQGLGGVFTKPICGILDMVSKTSEGLKNTLMENEVITQARLPRPFYGKFRYIKLFSRADAQVLYFINKKIDYFKKNPIEYNSSALYLSKDNTKKLLVFGNTFVYLINVNGYEVKTILRYSRIKRVVLQNPLKIKILFYGDINGKSHSSIKFHKDEQNVKKIFELFQESLKETFA